MWTRLTPPGCSSPNCYFMAPEGTEGKPLDAIAPIYGQGAYEMAEAFHQYAQAQRDTEHLSGITAGLHLTYVQRTARLRFPDYISVKVHRSSRKALDDRHLLPRALWPWRPWGECGAGQSLDQGHGEFRDHSAEIPR